jgi:hypothetical protein
MDRPSTEPLLLSFAPLPFLFLLLFALLFPALFPNLLAVGPLFLHFMLTVIRIRFRALLSKSEPLLPVLLVDGLHPVHQLSVNFRMASIKSRDRSQYPGLLIGAVMRETHLPGPHPDFALG